VKYWGTRQLSSPTILEKWPSRSPDLNSIENRWAYVQMKIYAQGHKTFSELKAAVIFEMDNIPISMLRVLHKLMPKRVAKVLELKGKRLSC